MSIGQELIGGLMDSSYTPTRNPLVTHVDAQGNFTDAKGNVVPLYTQPNFVQRVLSPTARQYNTLNAQQAAYPLVSQQGVMSQRANMEALDPTISNSNYTGLAYPAFNQNARNSQTAAQTFANRGGPQLTGDNSYLGAQTDNVLAQNRLHNVNNLAQLDTQTLTNQIKAGTLTGSELDDAIKLHPELAQIAKDKATYDKAVGAAKVNPTNLSNAVSTVGKTAANENAQANLTGTSLGTQQLIANTTASHPDWIKNTVSGNLLKELFGSSQQELGGTPLVGQVNIKAGTITKGRNPLYMNMADKASGMSGQSNIGGLPGAVADSTWHANDDGTNAPTVTPSPSLHPLIGIGQDGKRAGLSDAITGYIPPTSEHAIAADEALEQLNLKLDKDGNLAPANSWIPLTPQQIKMGQTIRQQVIAGKMHPTTKRMDKLHDLIGKLAQGYLGGYDPANFQETPTSGIGPVSGN